MEKNANEMKYISFGKGIAMLCIFLSHAPQCVTWVDNKWTAWGANGVKLLFVIAGFLTARSYINSNAEIRSFWKKRFWRLAPLYWCAILFWLIIYIFDEARMITFFMEDYDVIAVLLNVFLLQGLFVHGNNTVVPGGWYVGAISLFYLLAPFMIKGVCRLWRRSRWIVRGLPIASFAIIYIVNWSLYRVAFMTELSTIFEVYYSVLFQLPSLLLGINLYFELFENKEKSEWGNHKILIAMFFGGIAAWYSTYINNDFSYLVWGYMSVLVFVFLHNNEYLVMKDKLINQLGSMSYEFFLVHLFFTIAVLPMMAKSLLSYINETWAYALSMICVFACAYVISWIIWKGRLLILHHKYTRGKFKNV